MTPSGLRTDGCIDGAHSATGWHATKESPGTLLHCQTYLVEHELLRVPGSAMELSADHHATQSSGSTTKVYVLSTKGCDPGMGD